MLIWGIIAGMIGGAGLVLARAALRAAPPAAGEHPDMGVYRAQLAAVADEAARGLIAGPEAEGLRIEISRRMLEADRALGGADGSARAGGVALPLGLAAAALAGAFGLYIYLGAPGASDLPHAARLANAERIRAARPSQAQAEAAQPGAPAAPAPSPDYAALMDQLRASTVSHPDKIEGFRLLAENEARLGNFAAAARAKARVIALAGDGATARDHAELADDMIRAAGGLVTPEAEAALDAALRLDPDLPQARFYAGLMAAQTGRPDLAFALWRRLYEDSPADAPWMPVLAEQLGPLAEAAGVDYAPAPLKGPTAGDVAGAEAMAPADREAMIRGMVKGLEARLMDKGGSAAEWAQLIRALGVLGDADRTRAAWGRAQAALAADPAGLDRVRAEAKTAGVAP